MMEGRGESGEEIWIVAAVLIVFFCLCMIVVFGYLLSNQQSANFTRICAPWYVRGDGEGAVCNDYPGMLDPRPDGCTEIVISEAKSLICGNYTLEHRKK